MNEFEELTQQIEKFKSNMNSVSSIKESLTKILEVLSTYEKKLIEISLKYEDIRTDIRSDVGTSLLDTQKEYLKSISEFKADVKLCLEDTSKRNLDEILKKCEQINTNLHAQTINFENNLKLLEAKVNTNRETLNNIIVENNIKQNKYNKLIVVLLSVVIILLVLVLILN